METNTNTSKIAILIMAAGASKRMGSPKQLLPWGSTNLLGHSINQATNSKANKVFVVLGANHETIKKEINATAKIIVNKDWQLGLGASISSGVRHIQSLGYEGLLIMLADQPQIDQSYLNTLIEKFQSNDNQIVTTQYNSQVGVPAIFDRRYFKELSQLTGDHGAKQIIKEHMINVITYSPKKSLIDIDTLETYNHLHREFFSNQ